MSESVIFDDEFSDIDSEVLITLVKDRRVLWDKELEEYKSKTATTSAWREICIMLNPNFDQLPDSKKKCFQTWNCPPPPNYHQGYYSQPSNPNVIPHPPIHFSRTSGSVQTENPQSEFTRFSPVDSNASASTEFYDVSFGN